MSLRRLDREQQAWDAFARRTEHPYRLTPRGEMLVEIARYFALSLGILLAVLGFFSALGLVLAHTVGIVP